MGSRFAFRWLTGLLMVAVLAAVGVYTYNLGVAHGIAESGKVVAAPGAGVPAGVDRGGGGCTAAAAFRPSSTSGIAARTRSRGQSLKSEV